jgi:hypothetical protein
MKICILAMFGLLALANTAPQYAPPPPQYRFIKDYDYAPVAPLARSADYGEAVHERHENTKEKREANPQAWKEENCPYLKDTQEKGLASCLFCERPIRGSITYYKLYSEGACELNDALCVEYCKEGKKRDQERKKKEQERKIRNQNFFLQ